MYEFFLGAEDNVCALAKQAGVHENEARLLLYVLFAPKLKQYYIEKDISLEIWQNTMKDLRYKAENCKLLRGGWGSFSRGWFAEFFQLKRFAFGKLQFAIKAFHADYNKNGIILNPESKVVCIHIPRTGEPLTVFDQEYANANAKEFFAPFFEENCKIPFLTSSWLLFPKHKEILKPNTNLYAFIDRFEVLSEFEYEDYSNCFRVFDKPFTRWEDMPTQTSLQRAYVQMIKNGEKTGGAYDGIFLLEHP